GRARGGGVPGGGVRRAPRRGGGRAGRDAPRRRTGCEPGRFVGLAQGLRATGANVNDAERALILVVNGFLYVVYFLAANFPALIALVVGAAIAWRYDGEAARRAAGRARRYGRGEVG